MESNQFKASPSSSDSKLEVGEKSVSMDGTRRDQGGYPHRPPDLPLVSNAPIAAKTQPLFGENSDSTDADLASHRLEIVQSSGSSINLAQNGPSHVGIVSSASFGNSTCGQQQTPIRQQTYAGGKLEGAHSSKVAVQPKNQSVQQKMSLDPGVDERNSPLPGSSLNVKCGTVANKSALQSSIEKTPSISNSISQPFAGIASPNANSPVDKIQTVIKDSKAPTVSREGPMSTGSQTGATGHASAGKPLEPPLLSSQQPKAIETGFPLMSNVTRPGGAPTPHIPGVSQAGSFGTPMLMGRLPITSNRSGPDSSKISSSTPSTAAPDKGKRSSPNDTALSIDTKSSGPSGSSKPVTSNAIPPPSFNNPGVTSKPLSHQHMQAHHQNLHGPPGRRPLPKAASQSSRNPLKGPLPSTSSPSGLALYRQERDQTPPAMRELRVEDALLYLDDVKREFKDRPAIYNEFLAIMKNFKSQEVDTPGVIARVSKLFRGFNNLILGFNTFLPDGYKISLADLERQDAENMMREAAEQKKAAKVTGPKPGPKARKQLTSTFKAGQVPIQQASAPQQPPPVQPPTIQMHQHQGPPRQAPSSGFRGRPDDSHLRQSPQTTMILPPHQASLPPPRPSMSPSHPPPPVTQSTGPLPRPSDQAVHQILPPQTPALSQSQQQPLQQHQAVEFDHAISYVTTIKKRFANDPGTYHAFLEILHTYQKEQRGIKEVLEQVAHLFQDHPDLLKEFTFFLPDAVQEQAKERLHRAAAESESRQAAQRQQMIEQYHHRMGGQPAQNQQNIVEITRRQGQPVEPDVRGRKRQIDGQSIPMVTQPEVFVYNSAVERQFFDSAREALSAFSRDGGQAWAEFLKCMDMYAQEILTRSELLNFVEPLLGKRNNDLFEEFKRILSAAGAAQGATALMEDSWYSVPLAEIDFSRCRRCSPSYRALPRDYPSHPCSERSEVEAKVLNDIWVSLPVGSEESYTFRHMRRNTYEETLFRVEDERFEIDMVIDSNAATLHRLEPIAEEIAQLARVDISPTDLGLRNSAGCTGLGGRRFQYTFEKSILGVIHRNSIVRIYGDYGKEMLELLEKNPTVAVPLVLKRLRQKQNEWVKVRNRLNRHWKELAEQNYYKSLDHRSLTWRTIDKRAISTRTLIAEIKDRAANGGREGKEAYRQKLDKAKEEHGTFYEVTVGSKLDQDLDLTFLPKPDRRLFTPHQSVVYSNVSWAQRDAYRILAFALERGQISPADKERCHRLWVEFLGPWFGLSLSWMQKPAVTYQESTASFHKTVHTVEASVVSEDDEESLDEESNLIANQNLGKNIGRAGSGASEFTDHHPVPAGAHVSTLYGEGKVLQFRRSDRIYKVKLEFDAVAFLRPATVLCSMLPVENSAYTRELRAEDRTKLARRNDQLAFGTQSLYLFFRLHHILVQRLNIAKQLAYSVDSCDSLQSMVESIPNVNPKAVGKLRYEAYLSLLYSLLDGGVGGAAEGGKYEDRVRSLLGHGAYELATMDKLISHMWKDIQTMANDENMWNLVQLYRRHLLAGSFQPEAFRQEAAYISDGEPMFAFQHCPMPDSDGSVLHCEFVGIMDDEDEEPIDEEIETTEQHSSKRQKK